MRFARWVYLLSGLSGILLIMPIYFLEAKIGQDYPPAIGHPEFYYGFAGVTLAFQFLFLVIASDPVRFRPTMGPAMVEKATFSFAIALLYLSGRIAPIWLGAAAIDGTWLLLFFIAYRLTPDIA
jgi:hypothetical protein